MIRGLGKYLKKETNKKNYNFGRKYNNSLLAINNNINKYQTKANIVHFERDGEGNVIGVVVGATPDEFKSLTKDLFFCFPAPLGKPYFLTILDGAIFEDIINYCDPSIGIDMESDLDIAKLKLKLKLSQLGWEIDDVTR